MLAAAGEIEGAEAMTIDRDEDSIEYPYRPRPGVMLIACLAFAACAVWLGWVAYTNDRGLILNGIFEFETGGATIFYWSIAGLSALMAILGFARTLIGLFSNQHLQISRSQLSAPQSMFSASNTVIPFSSITGVQLQTVRSQRFLRIQHQKGKLTIAAINLPDATAFDTICARIAAFHAPR